MAVHRAKAMLRDAGVGGGGGGFMGYRCKWKADESKRGVV